jgi:iron complex outermembrane receptor protein
LGYNISNKLLAEKTNGYVKNARIFVQGQNLFIISKYSGLDPDNASQAGQDNAVSPSMRIVSFGLSVGF